jgi:hypothetical protein
MGKIPKLRECLASAAKNERGEWPDASDEVGVAEL